MSQDSGETTILWAPQTVCKKWTQPMRVDLNDELTPHMTCFLVLERVRITSRIRARSGR